MNRASINITALLVASLFQNGSQHAHTVFAVGPTAISDTSAVRPTAGWSSFKASLASGSSSVSSRTGCSLSFEVSFTKRGRINSIEQYAGSEDTSYTHIVLEALNEHSWILPDNSPNRIGFDVIFAPRAQAIIIAESGSRVLSVVSPADTNLKPTTRITQLSTDSSYLISTNDVIDPRQPRPHIGWDSLARTIVFPASAHTSGFQASILVTGQCDSAGNLRRVRMQPYYPMFDRVESMLRFVRWLPATIRGQAMKSSFVLPIVFAFKDRPRYRFVVVTDE